METSCLPIGERPYRPPVTERLKVWWNNRKHRRVGKAVSVLSKALQDDPSFAHTWMCSISMPIYDATREMDVEPNWVGPIPASQCNVLAKRLMKHLFGVTNCELK